VNKSRLIYLSYLLDEYTPTYGNRNKFICEKKSDISKGNLANDSSINTTVHIGTHIDMPYHFFEEGQTIEDFDIDFFSFNNVLFIDFIPENIIIKDDLIEKLQVVNDKDKYDILIVKTGICDKRNSEKFWESNYGFDSSIAEYLRTYFKNIRVIGFDSISVSSFTNRMLGRESHKAFLDPKHPILLLEDMDLTKIDKNTKLEKVTIAPLRIAKCDGLPCTVIAEIK